MLFRGLSVLSVDVKGWMVMLSCFCEVLFEYCEGKLVVIVDFEGYCFIMYFLPDWQEIE